MNFSKKIGMLIIERGRRNVVLNSQTFRLILKGFLFELKFARAIIVRTKWAAIVATGRK